MTERSVRFDMGNYRWVSDRESVGIMGTTQRGEVEFLITADALSELLNPDLDAIDPDTALETFIEFEADIHRIAQREFVKRLGGEPPILITSADVVT